VSDETGRPEGYVESFPERGAKFTVSTSRGREPVCARNGRELFFRNGNQMVAVQVSLRSGFRAEKSQVLFTNRFVAGVSRVNYDVSPDGQHFVMLQQPSPESLQMSVLQNWFDELKRLV